MNEQYKKLTKAELRSYGIDLSEAKTESDICLIKFVKQYYPTSASIIEVVVDSEYNDESYDNTLKYVVVYDKNGDELVPLKESREKCREALSNIYLDESNSNECVSSYFIRMNGEIPDLYVKI
jgi:hypothetical protein